LVEELENKYIDNNINDIKSENVTQSDNGPASENIADTSSTTKKSSKHKKKTASSKAETKTTTKSRSKSKKTKTTTKEEEGEEADKDEEQNEGSREKGAIEVESLRKEKFVEYEEADYLLQEISIKDQQILIGPKRLTRFEKARITGARSLQISFGAPLMIKADVKSRSSISLAIEELEKKVLPISIRRILPNGTYQDVPIAWLKT
jgi:DNA-directed RNA polymerases I, II, and III subunit RPABC2